MVTMQPVTNDKLK